MQKLSALRRRFGAVVLMALGALMVLPGLAFAQTMPTGSDGVTTIGTTFEGSVDDFTTLVVDLAPYLFGGLVSVLLIRLAIRWFGRVTKSV